MLFRISLLALAVAVAQSVSHALVTETTITPANNRGNHDRLTVEVVRHDDNSLTFSVSIACKKNEHAVLRSHVADNTTTFSCHSCMVYPINGTATARVTIPERLLATSTLSFSLASSSPVGGRNRILNSGANVYRVSLTDFASEATTVTFAPGAGAVRAALAPAVPPPINVVPIDG
ncbi:hypothetical protein Poly51_62230 [Rubripirellula tenax]|uniref:Uncharacterized protein n=1 Tax=Rubripirellula tenax TaxID=2528015 RepID=A0A5C6E7Q5_9BACT|nr:hypothetical protein Poly51_62230 [Rubripirellula tenax]